MVGLVLLLICFALPLAAQESLPDDLARLEVILDEPEMQPFEGQMVLATIRGTYRVTINREDLALRRMTDFDWVRLGQDSWTQQRVDGRAARVMERRVAFFPNRSGSVTLLPVVHKIEYVQRGERGEALVRSEPVEISVRPRPDGAGAGWLPVRALEISDEWDTEAGRLGNRESATRRVILRAFGTVPERLPPQPPMREPWLITFSPPEERSMQLTPQGPITTVVWTWKLRPITGEPGVLPSVTIPYYDTTDGLAGRAVIPAAPIGYATGARGGTAEWERGFVGGWRALLALVVGALLSLVATSGARRLSASAVRALAARAPFDPDLRSLGRAARSNDPKRFRACAARLLTRAGRSEAETVQALAPLDRHLFGRDALTRPDLATLGRRLRHLAADTEAATRGSSRSAVAAGGDAEEARTALRR